MNPDNVSLQFKKSKSGKAIVAFCDAYPDLFGTGNTEEQAISNFWKIFNAKQLELEHEESLSKKEAAKKVS